MASKKPEAFTDAENRIMRKILRDMAEREGWSQTETGRRLDIGQQAAGVILNKNGGFSRPTALALAALCGYDSPESLLADLGKKAGGEARTSSAWFERDIAVRHARQIGCDDRAIERVIARFQESSYASRRSKWWVEQFIREDRELEEERRAEAPPSTPALQASSPNKKGRRTA